jgi:hypothetical protein
MTKTEGRAKSLAPKHGKTCAKNSCVAFPTAATGLAVESEMAMHAEVAIAIVDLVTMAIVQEWAVVVLVAIDLAQADLAGFNVALAK